MLWLLPALISTVCWGVSYSFLKPVGPVSPFVVLILVGACNVTINLSLMGVLDFFNPGYFYGSWDNIRNITKIQSLCGYIFLNIGAGLSFLFAAQFNNVPIFIVTAIASAYPAVTAIVTFIQYGEYETIKPQLAIPGLLMIVVGLILLALSRK